MGASWKTTVAGLCAAIGLALIGLATQLGNNIYLIIIGTILSAAGTALLGGNARDNKVTSEQATGKTSAPPK